MAGRASSSRTGPPSGADVELFTGEIIENERRLTNRGRYSSCTQGPNPPLREVDQRLLAHIDIAELGNLVALGGSRDRNKAALHLGQDKMDRDHSTGVAEKHHHCGQGTR